MSDYRLLLDIQIKSAPGPALTMYRDIDSSAEIHEGDTISPGITAMSVEYDFAALRHDVILRPNVCDDEEGRRRVIEKMTSEGWQELPDESK